MGANVCCLNSGYWGWTWLHNVGKRWAVVSYWLHEFYHPASQIELKRNGTSAATWWAAVYSRCLILVLTKFVVPKYNRAHKTHCWTGIKRFARARLPSEREITEPTRNQRYKKNIKNIYFSLWCSTRPQRTDLLPKHAHSFLIRQEIQCLRICTS